MFLYWGDNALVMAKSVIHRLPEEKIAPVTPRKILGSVVGCLLMLGAANYLADWFLTSYSSNGGYKIAQVKWSKLLTLQRPVDVLVLGDSTGLQGVDPTVLDQTLGGRSLNLCTVGNMLVVNSAWMLDQYIQRFGPPKQVVLVHTYDVWHRKVNSSTRLLLAETPLPWGAWDAFEPEIDLGPEISLPSFLSFDHQPVSHAVSSPKPVNKLLENQPKSSLLGLLSRSLSGQSTHHEESAKTQFAVASNQSTSSKVKLNLLGETQFLLGRYVPLVMQNQTLSQLLLHPQDFFASDQAFKHNLEADGFINVNPNPKVVRQELKEHVAFVKSHRFKISADNYEALEHINQLADKYRFDVYLTTSPVYEELYRQPDFAAYLNEVETTLSQIASQSKYLHYIKSSSFPIEQMQEPEHLATPGAKIYSRKLAQTIVSGKALP